VLSGAVGNVVTLLTAEVADCEGSDQELLQLVEELLVSFF